MTLKTLKTAFAAATFAVCTLPCAVNATPVVANTGWYADILFRNQAGGIESDLGPLTFSLTATQSASFKVTDVLRTGDRYFLFSEGAQIAVTSLLAGAPNSTVGPEDLSPQAEAAWRDDIHEKLEYTFSGAGAYSFEIRPDPGVQIPASYYFRLDLTESTVPEPTSLALIGLGLAGLAVTRRRKSS